MTQFEYSAVNGAARIVQGNLEAADEQAVLRWLRESGHYPIRIQRQGTDEAPSAVGRLSQLARRPGRSELLIFTQQFHTLLEAGLEVDRSLLILSDLAENRPMRTIIRQLLADVQGGLSLADSLAKHPRIFSRLYVNMVKAGEAGGVLDLVLGRLAALLESAKAIRDEVVSAMLYPSLVLAVGGGAIVVLLNFVIPRFAGIFTESGQLLPASTRMLLAVSAVTAGYWWIVLAGLGLVALGVRGYIQTEEGKAAWHRLKLRLPVFGRLIRELEAARFARTLGTLLQSGVPVLAALGIVVEMVTNVAIAQALPRLRDGVRRGEGIAGPLQACGVFPSMAVHMAKVGEETGRLEEMLLKVADAYDGRVKTAIKRLLGLLEPLTILFLGLIVGFIVLSMLMAIFSISDLPI
ncbi:MAG: gspF [candidate division NC10 bacterium]|nr:gspF [candidate division NC10 bacterium]